MRNAYTTPITLARAARWTAVALAFAAPALPAGAQSARQSPTVKAVENAKPSIVVLKAPHARTPSKMEVRGTGVIVDERGLIVTNRHLVGSRQALTVRLPDGTELPGEVLARDEANDLALLRVQAGKPLAALPLGPAHDLMVGETVVAIGHPCGYTYTVSQGIISALGREITMPTGEVLTGLIQTDASINPGSSGGPLLNLDGELIGINVAVRDGAENIAFAIHADTVKKLLQAHVGTVKAPAVVRPTPRAELAAAPPREAVPVAGQTVAPAAEAMQAVSAALADVGRTAAAGCLRACRAAGGVTEKAAALLHQRRAVRAAAPSEFAAEARPSTPAAVAAGPAVPLAVPDVSPGRGAGDSDADARAGDRGWLNAVLLVLCLGTGFLVGKHVRRRAALSARRLWHPAGLGVLPRFGGRAT